MGELRESELLARIAEAGVSAEAIAAGVRLGPGDDMALLEVDGRPLLAAVDQVIEGRHFVPGTDEALIARKALARNLSDVAAMAAKPLATLASCVLPTTWEGARAGRLFDALAHLADAWACPLIGGDTAIHRAPRAGETASAPLVLSVTILAEPWPEALEEARAAEAAGERRGGAAVCAVVPRGAAQAGDGIYVTGRLGGSYEPGGAGRHLFFEPRVHEARALRRELGGRLHSMIDVSDGLGRDAAMLVGDGLQAVLHAAALPLRPGCDWRRALGDGEDYELCFAAAGDVPPSLPGRDGTTTPVSRIGEVRARPADGAAPRAAAPGAASGIPAAATGAPCIVLVGGRPLDASHLGWEHGADER